MGISCCQFKAYKLGSTFAIWPECASQFNLIQTEDKWYVWYLIESMTLEPLMSGPSRPLFGCFSLTQAWLCKLFKLYVKFILLMGSLPFCFQVICDHVVLQYKLLPSCVAVRRVGWVSLLSYGAGCGPPLIFLIQQSYANTPSTHSECFVC